MRAYGILANSYWGMFGFNDPGKPGVGFRFVTLAHTSIDDYVFTELMNQIKPALQKASSEGIEIRNIGLGTQQIDKTNQLSVFFQDDEDKVNRVKAMDEIKNRFGPNMITKVNTLLRVEGNTQFLDRNV